MGLVLLVGLMGCELTQPKIEPLPGAAELLVVTAKLTDAWGQVADCSGKWRPMYYVGFYVVQDQVFVDRGIEIAAIYQPKADRIIYSLYGLNDSVTVRHEMLHAMLRGMTFPGGETHPAEYFQEKCGDLVGHYPTDLKH